MLEEQGSVVEMTAAGVVVETIRQSACGSCRASKGCGQKLLSEIGQGKRFRVIACNPQALDLGSGDKVVLGLEESTFLTASLVIYLLPLVAMAAAAIIASTAGVAEPMVALSGLLGLGCGLLAVRRWGPQGDSRCRFQPQILRKLG